EAAALELLGELLRLLRERHHVCVGARRLPRRRPEAPDELGERCVVTHGNSGLGVANDRFELAAVADHPWVIQQAFDLFTAKGRNGVRLEAGERSPDPFA